MSARIYGGWSGRPDGVPEDESRCIQSVPDPSYGRFPIYKQCSRPRGKGLDGLYCGTHAKRHPARDGAQP